MNSLIKKTREYQGTQCFSFSQPSCFLSSLVIVSIFFYLYFNFKKVGSLDEIQFILIYVLCHFNQISTSFLSALPIGMWMNSSSKSVIRTFSCSFSCHSTFYSSFLFTLVYEFESIKVLYQKPMPRTATTTQINSLGFLRLYMMRLILLPFEWKKEFCWKNERRLLLLLR